MRIHRLQVGVANIDNLAARLVQQAIEYRALLSDTDSAKAKRVGLRFMPPEEMMVESLRWFAECSPHETMINSWGSGSGWLYSMEIPLKRERG
jgi:hypothetical protein